MTCDRAHELMQKYLEHRGPLSDPEFSSHLDQCKQCSLAFKHVIRVDKITRMVKDFDPELKFPGKLTDEIMGSLEDIRHVEKRISKNRDNAFILNINFRRLVAAAVILLLGVLGYEQYLVLDKINRLELQLEDASVKNGPASTALFKSRWEARAIMNFRKIKNNNILLAEKVGEVREMIKAIDSNPSTGPKNFRNRTLNNYNSMIIR